MPLDGVSDDGARDDGRPSTGPHEVGPEQERQALLRRLSSLSDADYSELLAVPAEHALERLDADSVSLSRWERDRGALRCVVNVGRLAPGEERFPVDETYDLSEWETVVDLARGHGTAYQLDDPDLPDQGRDLLEHLGHRSAVSVPVYVGERLWGELWATKRSTPLAAGAIEATTAVAAEISGMVALAERLESMARLAFHDPLTGLGNRRQLDDALATLLAPDGPGTTVVVCDVNDLKQVNDEEGHEAGDKVIMAVADALSSAAAPVPGAVATRLGGDEFALLLPGSQRTTAIVTLETAARALAASTPPVTMSCGIAVVPAGALARDALSVADAAQYAAKRRGALLFVSAGLEPDSPGPRRRFRDRPEPAHLDAPSEDGQHAAARAVLSLSQDLPAAPTTVRGRLGWLAEQLLTFFDIDHWALSTVDLTGKRSLEVASMGLRVGRAPEDASTDLLIDTSFPLEDYPLTERAVLENAWFVVDSDDDRADPGERALLAALGKQYVVGLGSSYGDEGLLLELYGPPSADVELLGATAALAAGALLGRPLQRLDTSALR
ncbi:MAG TPA: sensor domain-containing diguanylate cyclase [Actinomycetales bacterium]|nr:sensor domain-containing diguanylate cyclase [Actinomycetales bacterium]